LKAPEAPFEEPWQAQIFALTVALNEAASSPGPNGRRSSARACKGVGAEQYWEIWSEALVALLEARASPPRRRYLALTERWQAAARATPHGKPILLSAAD
jgi:hypothetical protein